MTHLRFDGQRHRHAGAYSGGGYFVSFGWLCNGTNNSDKDEHIQVYFVPGTGYQYK